MIALKGAREPMSELDDFLTKTLARQVEADEALHNGDVTLRMQMWSTKDPVTVFGALKSVSGWDEVVRPSAGSPRGSPTALRIASSWSLQA
jgi:hypothetical protein